MLNLLLRWITPEPPEEWQSSINYHLWQLEFYRTTISVSRHHKISLPSIMTTSIHYYLSRDVPAFISVASDFCPKNTLSPLEEKLKVVRQDVYPLCLG